MTNKYFPRERHWKHSSLVNVFVYHMAALNGDPYKCMAILGVGGITGIGIALAKSGAIFSVLQ